MSKHYFHVDDSEYYMVQVEEGELRKIKNYSFKSYLASGMSCDFEKTEFNINDYDYKLWGVAKEILAECLKINHKEFRTLAKKLKRETKGYQLVDEIVSKKLKKVDKKEVKQLRKIKKTIDKC